MKNLTILSLLSVLFIAGCRERPTSIRSASGVEMASTAISTDANGHSIEQKNIMERLERDNKPGVLKYLYVVSPFTGDLIFESNVKGKVTSSGKRLTPQDLTELDENQRFSIAKRIKIGNTWYATDQNPGDDGTYGDSIQYLYWFDQANVYHQAYIGPAIVHITDQPMTFHKTTNRTSSKD